RTVQSAPWPLAIGSRLVMLAFVAPVTVLHLENSDAGNDPTNTSTYRAFNLLSHGFGQGFNGPLQIVAELPRSGDTSSLPALQTAVARTAGVATVTPARLSPSGRIAVLRAYPSSAPQDQATTDLVNRLRDEVRPPFERQTGYTILVGGFTAGSIDFSHVLASKLPLFIAI